MYKLIITELAQSDLDSIVEYIAIHLANPIAAADFLERIEECYSYLKTNPFIYSKSCDTKLEKEGYRKALVNNYIVFFKIYDDENAVIIHRIIYGSKDYQKLL